MNKQIVVVLIALIGVGLYALPQTVALFAGQHSFVNIDATGNQIDCTKCHGDINAELSSNYNTITGTDGPHADFKCEYCHRIEAGSSSGDNAFGVVPYTAAGGLRRMYLIPVSDMEAGNFPATILGSDVLVKDVTLNGVALKFGKGKLSAVLASPNDTVVLNVGGKYDLKLASTYNATTGTPLDTNPATRNSGLDLSKVVVNITASRPYYTVLFDGAGSRAVNPGTSYHAASLVSCMECHGGEEPTGHYSRVVDGTDTTMGPSAGAECADCHYGSGLASNGEGSSQRFATLWAGGFGLTSKPGDTGDKEAHQSFVMTDDGMSVYKDGANNGACVACHTHVSVDITYEKATTYKFDVSKEGGSMYIPSNFVTGGATYTYSR